MRKTLKYLYKIIPFKKQIFLFVKMIYTPQKKIYKHLHFRGKIKVRIDNDHSFKMNHYGYQIENELFWDGIENAWEKNSFNIWKELCRTSKSIVDVGANTGAFSLIAQTVNKQATVYAFEPIERNYEKLVQNCALNNYPIQCFKSALSDKTGDAFIYENPKNDIIYSVTVNKSLIEITEEVVKTKIDIVRLDEFIEQNNIMNIDLLKIDAETHEPEILAGLGIYLEKFQPTLLIEILNDEIAEQIEHIIADIPYLFFMINEEKGIRKVDHLMKSESFNFLICKEDIAKKTGLII